MLASAAMPIRFQSLPFVQGKKVHWQYSSNRSSWVVTNWAYYLGKKQKYLEVRYRSLQEFKRHFKVKRELGEPSPSLSIPLIYRPLVELHPLES